MRPNYFNQLTNENFQSRNFDVPQNNEQRFPLNEKEFNSQAPRNSAIMKENAEMGYSPQRSNQPTNRNSVKQASYYSNPFKSDRNPRNQSFERRSPDAAIPNFHQLINQIPPFHTEDKPGMLDGHPRFFSTYDNRYFDNPSPIPNGFGTNPDPLRRSTYDTREYGTPAKTDREPPASFRNMDSNISPIKFDRETPAKRRDSSVPILRRDQDFDVPKPMPTVRDRKFDAIFEEYRKTNFAGIPIYRAKFFGPDRNTVEKSPIEKRDLSQPRGRMPNNPVKPNMSQSTHPVITASTNFSTEGNAPMETAGFKNTYQSPERRNQPATLNPMYRSSPLEKMPVERTPYEGPMTETSQRIDTFEEGNINNFSTMPRQNESMLIKGEGGRCYSIFTGPALDYPFQIISAEPIIREPSPDVGEKIPPKSQEIRDPFLQNLATTYAGRSENKKKSMALINLEQSMSMRVNEAAAHEEEEEGGETTKSFKRTVKSYIPPEDAPSEGSFSPLAVRKTISITKSEIVNVREIEPKETTSPDISLKESQNLSPIKKNETLKQASTVGEKKLELQPVRVSTSEQEKEQPSAKSAPVKEVSKKLEAKSAGFLKKLEEMRNKSQSRLTGMVASHTDSLNSIDRTPTSSIFGGGRGDQGDGPIQHKRGESRSATMKSTTSQGGFSGHINRLSHHP